VESVTLGHGERTVTLTRGVPPAPGDPYNGGHFGADLHAPGLSASRQVFVFGWSDIAGFFSDLAQHWRGWDGPKTWTSPEHDLTVTATHESGSHVRVAIVLQDGPAHTWSASTSVDVEPGEEMTLLARDLSRLTSTTSS